MVAALAYAASPAWGAACVAQSAERTAALVELYTSARCSSCARAEHWLSTLGARFGPERLVPLVVHVDYRDYLRSTDPGAERRVSERLRRFSHLQRSALVYSPQVLLQGRDFPGWQSGAFETVLKRINARTARAQLGLEIVSIGPHALDIALHSEVREAGEGADAAVYIAAYQNRPPSALDASENGALRLQQDHVALDWLGPIAFGPQGRIEAQRTLVLLPNATPAQSGVVAFVQNRRSGEVLQALLLSACSP